MGTKTCPQISHGLNAPIDLEIPPLPMVLVRANKICDINSTALFARCGFGIAHRSTGIHTTKWKIVANFGPDICAMKSVKRL